MRSGQLNKARHGKLEMGPPVGLVYRNDGTIGLDPDVEVQKALQLVFDTFDRTGSAMETVRYFLKQGLLFPRRLHGPPTRVTCCGRRRGTRALCRCCTIHDTQGLSCMAAHARAICQTAAREPSRLPEPRGSLPCRVFHSESFPPCVERSFDNAMRRLRALSAGTRLLTASLRSRSPGNSDHDRLERALFRRPHTDAHA